MANSTFRLAAAALTALAVTAGCERDNPQKDAPVTAQNSPATVQSQSSIGAPGESIVTEFKHRLDEYMALQQNLVHSLKKLPKQSSPKDIDANQRALLALVAKARTDAKQGDVFVPEMQTYIRALVRSVLAGPDGGRIKSSLMDENPMGVKLAVNGRYPDTIPLATMPPDMLAALPRLPEDMEYRFVGNRLVLLDTTAHLIVDFVDNTFEI
jgi:hypothetical protein